MGVAAAWVDVLAHWSGSPEVVVMTPVPGRPTPSANHIVGCLTQSLLVRLDTSGDPSLLDLTDRFRSAWLAATERQFYPYEKYSRTIRNPAWIRFEGVAPRPGPDGVEVIVTPGEHRFGGLRANAVDVPRDLMFDWPLRPGEVDQSVPELNLVGAPDGSLRGSLIYNDCAFSSRTIEAVGAHASAVIEAASMEPGRRLRTLTERHHR